MHQQLGSRGQGAEEDEQERGRARATPPAVPGRVERDGGMPAPLRTKMERAFGTDFADVRIHEGAQAQAMGAVAYAQGNDVFFQPGRYDPESHAGQELLGHELAHVVQQRNGKVVPQGKGAPLNDDPALEAEADLMGARAAAGQSTGMAAPAGAAPANVVQRYKETGVGEERWRISEHNQVLAKTSGAPGDRSKFVWAEPVLVQQANQALIAAGSFVRLQSGGDAKNLILREDGRNAALEDEVLRDANLHDDLDPQANYFRSLNALLERNDPSGVEERAHQLAGGRAHPVPEQQMQAEYFEALRQRREEAKGTDRTVTLPKVIPSFDPNAAPHSATYTAMDHHQDQRGVLYTPSDCNEAARVIMGVAESRRDEQPVVGTGGAPHPVAVRDIGFGKQGGGGTIAEKGGLSGLADALRAYAAVIDGRGLAQEQVEVFQQQWGQAQHNEGLGPRMLRQLKDAAPEVYRDFSSFAQLDDAVQPEIGDALVTFRLDKSGLDPSRSPRLYRRLLAVLTETLHVDEPRAREILLANGLAETTIYFEVSDCVDRLVQWLQNPANHPSAEQRAEAELRATGVTNDNVLWNKHWGGVVMRDGADFLTLENDASTTASPSSQQVGQSDTYVNQEWGFAMYGTVEPAQTFHHQMMATEDFGDHASTMRYQRRPAPLPHVQEPQGGLEGGLQLTPDEQQLLRCVLDLALHLEDDEDVDLVDLVTPMAKTFMAVNRLRLAVNGKYPGLSLREAAAAAQHGGLLG